MTAGQKIIQKQVLTISEANCVCKDLDKLSDTGVWDMPDWATELAKHYDVGEAHVVIQLAGWKAAAKAYKHRVDNPPYIGPYD